MAIASVLFSILLQLIESCMYKIIGQVMHDNISIHHRTGEYFNLVWHFYHHVSAMAST